jgi:transcriptional regulator with XRE-family HTH domain
MTPEQLKDIRIRLGLTQEQMSRIMFTHAMTVSRWERGTITPPPLVMAIYAKINERHKKWIKPRRFDDSLKDDDPAKVLFTLLGVK